MSDEHDETERRGRVSAPSRQRIVLVGAGHAHLLVLARAHELANDGIELILVDPDAFRYSGMATGVLGGAYEAFENRVDPAPIAERMGARFVRAHVVEGDVGARELVLSHADGNRRERLPHDLVSFNVGSEVDSRGLDVRADVVKAKPLAGLMGLRARLERDLSRARRSRVVVVGGGATGCEIAANVDALARRLAARVEVAVVTGASRLLDDRSRFASRALTRALNARGVAVHTGLRVVRVGDGEIVSADSRTLECDVAVLATGLRAPAILEQLRLGDADGMEVGASLRSVREHVVFGAGDCVRFVPRPLPRVGVYAVRQAPVLLHNLHAAATGRTFACFRPQRRYLLILDMGRGRGFALWGRLHWHGRASRRLKEAIDRRFVRSFERIGQPQAATGRTTRN